MGSATLLYIDQYDKGGNNNLQGFLSSLSNYGSTSRRGFIKVTKQSDLTWFQTYEFSTTVDNTGWWTIAISNVILDADFTDDDLCFVSFNVSGPQGIIGATGPAASFAAGTASGTTLTFVTYRVYGTITTPETGSISADITGGLLGVTNIVIHNSISSPTFSAVFKKLSGSGVYATSQINYIYSTYIDSTNIIYSINQVI